MNDLSQLTAEEIRARLEGKSQTTMDLPSFRTDVEYNLAAVLVPFLRIENEWHLLYIRRASHDDDYHSGQVAFAGGKHETEDADLQQTALREAHEEIGLLPQHVDVLGNLNYHYSISQFRIMPVVAQIPWPYDLVLEASEVAKAFTIPLDWLANPDNYEVRHRQLDAEQSVPVVYFDDYQGERLWGATARMTLSLLSQLRQQDQ